MDEAEKVARKILCILFGSDTGRIVLRKINLEVLVEVSGGNFRYQWIVFKMIPHQLPKEVVWDAYVLSVGLVGKTVHYTSSNRIGEINRVLSSKKHRWSIACPACNGGDGYGNNWNCARCHGNGYINKGYYVPV